MQSTPAAAIDVPIPAVLDNLLATAGISHAAFLSDVATGISVRCRYTTAARLNPAMGQAAAARLPSMVVRLAGGQIETRFKLADGVTVECADGGTSVSVARVVPQTIICALPGRPFHMFLEHPAIGRVTAPITRAVAESTSTTVWLES